jgi:tetratricopeptide (TPR) repeat protein
MRCFRRRVGFAGFRLVCLLAGAFAVSIAGLSPAAAQTDEPVAQPVVQVSGLQDDGFGRIELAFDREVPVRAQSRNGVLVVSFGDAATIVQQRLSQQMPAYISVVRADPDGTGMRIGLTQNFRANLLNAGERVFIDLLPERWTGLEPGLPAEVVAELARRAFEAEALFQSDRDRRLNADVQKMPVRVAELPTLTRLIFEPPVFVPITERRSDEGLELRFDEPLELNAERVLNTLPGIRVAEQELSDGSLFVRLFLADGYTVRSFHEERNYVVDIEPLIQPAVDLVAASDQPIPLPPRRGEPVRASGEAFMPVEPRMAEEATETASGVIPEWIDDDMPDEVIADVPTPVTREAAAPVVAPLPQLQPLAEATSRGELLSDGLRIAFAFGENIPAAAFWHAGVMRVVFHTTTPLGISPLPEGAEAYASLDAVLREGEFVTVRLNMPEPNIVRLLPDHGGWTLNIGEMDAGAALPLTSSRESDDAGRNLLTVPLAAASGVLWIDDPDSGERLAVVTAPGEAQNIAKLQRFVEVHLLPTAHGLAIAAQADDIYVNTQPDLVVIGRGAGLTLSGMSGAEVAGRNPLPLNPLISREIWEELQRGQIRERERALIEEVLKAPPSGRMAARMEIAKLLIANDLAPEGNAVLAFVENQDPQAVNNPHFLLLRAIALIEMGRYDEARSLLSAQVLENDSEADLWRAHLAALEGRWQPAIAGFRRSRIMIDSYPDALQGRMRLAAIRAGLALEELPFAERELAQIGLLSPGSVSNDALGLANARFDMAMGRPEAALAAFERIAEHGERPYASEAKLRWIQASLDEGIRALFPVGSDSLSLDEAIAQLELLAVSWRGDDVEAEAIGQLGRLYAEQGRWRDAFLATRSANQYFPDHPVTRELHEETARIFNELFLGRLGEDLSRVEAVALFFDFRDFLPIGRRGDEIVRRLSDRLVELDLLDNAAELLRHQIDNRLQGAARSTVAARLATIYLMEGNPDDALHVLRQTRLPELPEAIKRARMLLEARALSDLTRTDLALEVIDGERGLEVDRLRADIYWTGRRWREAGEAHEHLLGRRWQEAEPLTERERTDVLRAAIAYTLGSEDISLDRLRAKFIGQMADSEDAELFAIATTPDIAPSDAFRDIARRVTASDTLADFLEAYRERYPDAAVSARPPRSSLRDPEPIPGPGEGENMDLSAMGGADQDPAPRG